MDQEKKKMMGNAANGVHVCPQAENSGTLAPDNHSEAEKQPDSHQQQQQRQEQQKQPSKKRRSRSEMEGRDSLASTAVACIARNGEAMASLAALRSPFSQPIQKKPRTSSSSFKFSGGSTAQKVAPTPSPVPVPDASTWRDKIVPHLPRCHAAEGIRSTSHFITGKYANLTTNRSATTRSHCLRRLLQELVNLEDDLPDTVPGIFVRYDEECPQFVRALMAAPQGTPYALGLFCFDLWIPDDYPNVPPKMVLLTTGGGTVRFSPNLYSDGKVCLSLLNTWQGPKWNPRHSTLLQVFVSIQGLILGVQHPYYLEPGHGGWEKNSTTALKPTASAMVAALFSPSPTPAAETSTTAPAPPVAAASADVAGTSPAAPPVVSSSSSSSDSSTAAAMPVVDASVPVHVQQYEDRLRIGTIKFAILDMLRQADKPDSRHYLYPFREIIQAHIYHCKDSIIPTVSQWVSAVKTSYQRRQVGNVAKMLEEELTRMPKPSVIANAEPETSVAAVAVVDGDAKQSADGKDKNESAIQAVIASKRQAMEDAAAAQDYATAARLQNDLKHLDEASRTTHTGIENRIIAKKQAMEAAAESKDYISAGKHQTCLQRLEKNKKLLEHLERRMFDSAAKLDFVRAGKFQEQFEIILQHSDSEPGGLDSGITAESSGKEIATGSSAQNSTNLPSITEALLGHSKFISKIDIADMLSGGPPPSGTTSLFGLPPAPPPGGLSALSASFGAPDDGFGDGYTYNDDDFGDY
mmetsp:Transcript_8794/g.15999  ORF Transcript_8794/g.15999 Transcript_8794/m.15999 type:complete len:749 (-) Transcript_8794:1186-3432(-)